MPINTHTTVYLSVEDVSLLRNYGYAGGLSDRTRLSRFNDRLADQIRWERKPSERLLQAMELSSELLQSLEHGKRIELDRPSDKPVAWNPSRFTPLSPRLIRNWADAHAGRAPQSPNEEIFIRLDLSGETAVVLLKPQGELAGALAPGSALESGLEPFHTPQADAALSGLDFYALERMPNGHYALPHPERGLVYFAARPDKPNSVFTHFVEGDGKTRPFLQRVLKSVSRETPQGDASGESPLSTKTIHGILNNASAGSLTGRYRMLEDGRGEKYLLIQTGDGFCVFCRKRGKVQAALVGIRDLRLPEIGEIFDRRLKKADRRLTTLVYRDLEATDRGLAMDGSDFGLNASVTFTRGPAGMPEPEIRSEAEMDFFGVAPPAPIPVRAPEPPPAPLSWKTFGKRLRIETNGPNAVEGGLSDSMTEKAIEEQFLMTRVYAGADGVQYHARRYLDSFYVDTITPRKGHSVYFIPHGHEHALLLERLFREPYSKEEAAQPLPEALRKALSQAGARGQLQLKSRPDILLDTVSGQRRIRNFSGKHPVFSAFLMTRPDAFNLRINLNDPERLSYFSPFAGQLVRYYRAFSDGDENTRLIEGQRFVLLEGEAGKLALLGLGPVRKEPILCGLPAGHPWTERILRQAPSENLELAEGKGLFHAPESVMNQFWPDGLYPVWKARVNGRYEETSMVFHAVDSGPVQAGEMGLARAGTSVVWSYAGDTERFRLPKPPRIKSANAEIQKWFPDTAAPDPVQSVYEPDQARREADAAQLQLLLNWLKATSALPFTKESFIEFIRSFKLDKYAHNPLFRVWDDRNGYRYVAKDHFETVKVDRIGPNGEFESYMFEAGSPEHREVQGEMQRLDSKLPALLKGLDYRKPEGMSLHYEVTLLPGAGPVVHYYDRTRGWKFKSVTGRLGFASPRIRSLQEYYASFKAGDPSVRRFAGVNGHFALLSADEGIVLLGVSPYGELMMARLARGESPAIDRLILKIENAAPNKNIILHKRSSFFQDDPNTRQELWKDGHYRVTASDPVTDAFIANIDFFTFDNHAIRERKLYAELADGTFVLQQMESGERVKYHPKRNGPETSREGTSGGAAAFRADSVPADLSPTNSPRALSLPSVSGAPTSIKASAISEESRSMPTSPLQNGWARTLDGNTANQIAFDARLRPAISNPADSRANSPRRTAQRALPARGEQAVTRHARTDRARLSLFRGPKFR